MESLATNVCLHCLREVGGAADCPHCGAVGGQTVWTPPGLRPGTLLHGKYLIGRMLGRGGFAVTYLGMQTALGNRVAVKEFFPMDLAVRDARTSRVLPRQTEGSATRLRDHFHRGLERFIEEGRNIVRCHDPNPHPNLVRVVDYFEENGTAYLVMDYVDGVSLDQYLKNQSQDRLDEQGALRVLMPVLDGLRAVHRQGFYHRDVKPANIYLSHNGPVILLDFGAARAILQQETRTQTVFLTPGYAPPEQYSGKGVQGAWTDVYGCAATLYRCVTGLEPASAMDRMSGTEMACPSDVPGCRISPAFESVVLWGLALDHSQRPQTIEEFQQGLLNCGAGKCSFIPKVRQAASAQGYANTRPKRGRLVTGLLLALIMELGVGGYFYSTYRHGLQQQSEQREHETLLASTRAAAARLREQADTDVVHMYANEAWNDAQVIYSEAVNQEHIQEAISLYQRAANGFSTASALAVERQRVEKEGRAEEERLAYGEETHQEPNRETGAVRVFAGIEFVWIPPGTFTMGSPESEKGRSDNEGPQRQVTISQGFWLAKYEVTQAQWENVMRSNSSVNKGPQNPADNVSWEDAQAFIRKLNQRGEGTFRLPTEAEWEYACRAGTTTRFYWGDDLNESQIKDYAWYSNNSDGKTHPVGEKRPNAWGLYDMSGNMWEWCQDWYEDYLSGAVTDPMGSRSGRWRMLRGGSWLNRYSSCRSAARHSLTPDYRFNLNGFRVVRSP